MHDLYYLRRSYCCFEPARATLHYVNRQGWSLPSGGRVGLGGFSGSRVWEHSLLFNKITIGILFNTHPFPSIIDSSLNCFLQPSWHRRISATCSSSATHMLLITFRLRSRAIFPWYRLFLHSNDGSTWTPLESPDPSFCVRGSGNETRHVGDCGVWGAEKMSKGVGMVIRKSIAV